MRKQPKGGSNLDLKIANGFFYVKRYNFLRNKATKSGLRAEERSFQGNFDAPIFLDASTHLYRRVCPSVGPSIQRVFS